MARWDGPRNWERATRIDFVLEEAIGLAKWIGNDRAMIYFGPALERREGCGVTEMGVLNAMTEAMMMTTRLMVLPTACVTGLTRPSARKATSL